MTAPPFLQRGDLVGICAPARKIAREELKPCIAMLEANGLKVVLADNLFVIDNQFAGTDAQRAADLNALLNDDSIKAILFARGGYGCLRIADSVDFTSLHKQPKWLVGYSDVTVFHAAAQRQGVQSLHAPMGICFGWENYAHNLEQALAVLMGQSPAVSYQPTQADGVSGAAAGTLIGGNLSLLNNLVGTPFEHDYDGAILFIEDVDEYLYHIDRMLQHLRLSGRLAKLAGLIVGGFDDLKDNETPFGRTYREIVLDAVRDYDYPLAFDFPAGHGNQNLPLVMGRKARLSVAPHNVQLTYEA